MANKTKEATAPKPKTNINYKQAVRRFVAKPVAFLAVFILASYGMRQLLRTLDDHASVALTILCMAALTYILLIED